MFLLVYFHSSTDSWPEGKNYLFNLNLSLLSQRVAYSWCWIKVAKWINQISQLSNDGVKKERDHTQVFRAKQQLNLDGKEPKAPTSVHTPNSSKQFERTLVLLLHSQSASYVLILASLSLCFLCAHSYLISFRHWTPASLLFFPRAWF